MGTPRCSRSPNKMKLYGSLVALCLIQMSQALFVSLGSCPSPSVVANFDAAQYAGTWYENRKYPVIFEVGQRCVRATYTDNGDGTIGVLNEATGLFGGPVSISGTARQTAPPSGKLAVSFPSASFSGEGAYWVLDTDYTSFAVVYSCTPITPLLKSQIVWILTRDQNPDASVINAGLAVMDLNSLSRFPLRVTDQTNC